MCANPLSRTRTTLAGVTIALLAATAAAETRQWVPFDNEPPGTAPTITLNGELSSLEKSVFDIKIHGMWIMEHVVPGQNEPMHAISLPGAGAMATNALGLPELPGVALNIACTVQGDQGEAPTTDFQLVPMEQIELADIRVYPRQMNDALDETGGDGDTTFYYDDTFYATMDTPFPPLPSRMLSDYRIRRGIGSMAAVTTCMQCIPSEERLVVSTRYQVQVYLSGSPMVPVDLRPRAAAHINDLYHNSDLLWDLQLAALNMDADEGDYLIVTPDQYRGAVLPLISQKTERGLRVTVVETSDLGSGFDATDVKDAISDWYDQCQNRDECYVLLIGDIDEMPMHEDPLNNLPSDHYYVCLEDEFYPSCPIGRYSCDSETDLGEQIAKTIEYSEYPMMGSEHYERGLLAAHKQQSKEYVECIEDIEAATYDVQPDFTMYSGRETGSTVANVVADINDTHYGLVMYRGHGWRIKWGSNWNTQNEELWDTDAAGLNNGAYTPIVVAVACGNSAIQLADDCIGEAWMEGDENGGVAHIGSTRSSNTETNHYFARIFNSFYWSNSNFSLGLLMQGCWQWSFLCMGSSNTAKKTVYMSQLLGDPELRPWIKSPTGLNLIVPGEFLAGAHDYSVEVYADDSGLDLNNVIIVSVVNGEIREMARCDTDGQVLMNLDLNEDDHVVFRARAELALALDDRYEAFVAAPCPADLDGNGEVDINDLLVVVGAWGTAEGDITGDGATSIEDVLAVIAGFGGCP